MYRLSRNGVLSGMMAIDVSRSEPPSPDIDQRSPVHRRHEWYLSSPVSHPINHDPVSAWVASASTPSIRPTGDPSSVTMTPAAAAEFQDRQCMICHDRFGTNLEETQCPDPILYSTTLCTCKIVVGRTCMSTWFDHSEHCAICGVRLREGARPGYWQPVVRMDAELFIDNIIWEGVQRSLAEVAGNIRQVARTINYPNGGTRSEEGAQENSN